MVHRRLRFLINSSAIAKMWTSIVSLALCFGTSNGAEQFLKELPTGFPNGSAKWAWISYEIPSVAVIQGKFNRSALDAPHVGKVSDPGVAQMYVYLIMIC